MATDFRALFQEFVCDIVFFLYKIGEALLDASIRPFITTAVCNDMFDSFGGDEDDGANSSTNNGYTFSFHDVANTQHRHAGVVCLKLNQFPSEISDEVQRQASGVVVAYRILTSVPAIFLGLFCGAWSDTRGRKLPMMVPSAGSCLAVVFYLLSLHVHRTKVALLLLGAATQGVFGKTPLISMAVNSYVSDMTDTEQRTRRLGRLLACSFLGTFLGSLLAGILQDVSRLSTALIVVSTCHASCVLVVFHYITEVVEKDVEFGSTYEKIEDSFKSDESETSEERGEDKEEKRKKKYALFSWEGLKESMMAVVKKREGNKRCVIVISLTGLILTQMLKVGDQDVTVLFIQQPPLSWPSSFYGYLLAADYGTMGLTLLVFLTVLSHVLSMSDIHIVLLAVGFKLTRALWAGFCTHTWMMFTSIVLGAVGGLINPGLRSLLSKTASAGEVGKLFSIQASLETLSKLVGSGVFTGIYAATVDVFPAAAYLSEVFIYLLMAALIVYLGQLIKTDGAHELLLAVPKTYHSMNKADRNQTGTLGSSPETLTLIRGKDMDEGRSQNGLSLGVPKP